MYADTGDMQSLRIVYPVVAQVDLEAFFPFKALDTEKMPVVIAAINANTDHIPPKARSTSIYELASCGFPILTKKIRSRHKGIHPTDSRIFLKPALLYIKTSDKYLFNYYTSRHNFIVYGHTLITGPSAHVFTVMKTA